MCQKHWEPAVITINHRDIIKEWAGAVRLAEVRGWKGLLDVVGGVEAPPRDRRSVLICSFQDWVIHRLWDGFTSKVSPTICVSSFHACDFSLLCHSCSSPSIFSLWWQEFSVLPGRVCEYFLVASWLHSHLPTLHTFISLWYASALLQQPDMLILTDLTPKTYPSLSSNLEIPKLKITLS